MMVSSRLLVVCALVLAGCASTGRLDSMIAAPPPPPLLRFEADTFAFPNDIRSKNPDKPDLYANYCFVMARAITQFLRFARFDPDAPRVSADEYAERVRQVVVRPPWAPALPPAERIVIPGYASLRAFSMAEERAVKDGLVGRFWTWVHWTNWRVVFPVPASQQERVVEETLAELRAGRTVQLLVTNWPTIELNHTVVAYEYRTRASGDIELIVYDPNDPWSPNVVLFERAQRRFFAERIFDTTPGPIRAFRMYYSPLL